MEYNAVYHDKETKNKTYNEPKKKSEVKWSEVNVWIDFRYHLLTLPRFSG